MESRKRKRTKEELDDENIQISSARRSISPPSIRSSANITKQKTSRSGESVDQSFESSSLRSKSVFNEHNDQSSAELLSNTFPRSTLNSYSNPSPVQLSFVKDLPSSANLDTISLHEILGDPLIKECWLFNYCFNVDFMMKQFDGDVRHIVQVKIVHGSWRKEDYNKIHIDEAARRYPNVHVITAYMPEAYGTHHTKMIIIFRHDDHAQVVIHTANMLPCDWKMTQGVWRSPLLPFQSVSSAQPSRGSALSPIGCGLRFKEDLLAYLSKYDSRTKDLVAQLSHYDFTAVKAALVASAPGKYSLKDGGPEGECRWGWPALKRILGAVCATSVAPHIVVQISSIASVGDKWTSRTFFDTLSTPAAPENTSSPKFSVVFPTSEEIRKSVDGYSAGGSIHIKINSAAQKKQLAFLRPMLCHWAGDLVDRGQSNPASIPQSICKAGRGRVAPHIKTYVRFSDKSMKKIDWAMLTSANLSTQAWGAAPNESGEVRISSYEIGIIVWPALWDEGREHITEMVPVFKGDMPTEDEGTSVSLGATDGCVKNKVGWRMPYDLPLVPYEDHEMPWCASLPHEEPDWTGESWPGLGNSTK